jgi:5'/3'-nucleotidase SurE
VVIGSGTVGNAQFAATRGLPAIAVSAGTDTVDNKQLANSYSVVTAKLTVKLLKALIAKANGGPLLPEGIALNVNVPNAPSEHLGFAFSRFGTTDAYQLKFNATPPYGLGIGLNQNQTVTADRAYDEAVVYKKNVSVTAMQVAFEAPADRQLWLNLTLKDLFDTQLK